MVTPARSRRSSAAVEDEPKGFVRKLKGLFSSKKKSSASDTKSVRGRRESLPQLERFASNYSTVSQATTVSLPLSLVDTFFYPQPESFLATGEDPSLLGLGPEMLGADVGYDVQGNDARQSFLQRAISPANGLSPTPSPLPGATSHERGRSSIAGVVSPITSNNSNSLGPAVTGGTTNPTVQVTDGGANGVSGVNGVNGVNGANGANGVANGTANGLNVPTGPESRRPSAVSWSRQDESETTAVASEKVDESSGSDTNEESYNEGLREWNRRRLEWTGGGIDLGPPQESLLDSVPEKMYIKIYDALIKDARPLKQPLNLADAVPIIKAGWIADGTWPKDPK